MRATGSARVGRAQGIRAAQARHPAASWAPDHERLRRQLASRLHEEGHPTPAFSATLLGVRGVLGMDRATFAGAIGVEEHRLVAMEEGGAGAPPEEPWSGP